MLCTHLSSAERKLPFLVTTEWLSEHLNDKDIVVLQSGYSSKEFSYGHIPKARFLWYTSLAPSTPELNTEMPSVKEAQKVFQELGINKTSKIIIAFTGTNITLATRMVFAFTYYGMGNQVSFLDGGYEAWKKEGRVISQGIEPIQKSALTINSTRELIVDAEWISKNLASPEITIVDARAKNFFDGKGGGTARQGHIKGAKNLVFSSLVDSTNKFKSQNELQQLFENVGIKKSTMLVAYCHVGQQATLVYFAATMLGYKVKVYDGSFEDWNYHDDRYPIEK